MSCSIRRSVLSLMLLVLAAAFPLHAAPENAQSTDLLNEILGVAPCEAVEQSPLPEISLLAPEAGSRIIYPDCGVYCSDSRCSGRRTLSACTAVGGVPGTCVAKNQVCPNEPGASPCTCTVID